MPGLLLTPIEMCKHIKEALDESVKTTGQYSVESVDLAYAYHQACMILFQLEPEVYDSYINS